MQRRNCKAGDPFCESEASKAIRAAEAAREAARSAPAPPFGPMSAAPRVLPPRPVNRATEAKNRKKRETARITRQDLERSAANGDPTSQAKLHKISQLRQFSDERKRYNTRVRRDGGGQVQPELQAPSREKMLLPPKPKPAVQTEPQPAESSSAQALPARDSPGGQEIIEDVLAAYPNLELPEGELDGPGWSNFWTFVAEFAKESRS
jgi:hypothetical protein